jgi:hypothetical protein
LDLDDVSNERPRMNIPKEWLNLEEMCKLINDNIENHIHSSDHKANYVDINGFDCTG